ncbi:MAG: glycogen debranching enzyme family protein [Acidobacteria bacterium]|nr:glycogen debranching enzyme family protein [Acidobacteriota bacterium]
MAARASPRTKPKRTGDCLATVPWSWNAYPPRSGIVGEESPVLPVRKLNDLTFDPEHPVEWLVTNGLGGYASGTVQGAILRRYHGLLVAALPSPLGRTMMLSAVSERLRLPDRTVLFIGPETLAGITPQQLIPVSSFHLDGGLPVWSFESGEYQIERCLFMPYRQNTVVLTYRMLSGEGTLRLGLRPALHFRPHDAPVSRSTTQKYALTAVEDQFEIACDTPNLPKLRVLTYGPSRAFTVDSRESSGILYHTERDRGYASEGSLYLPGYFRFDLRTGEEASLIASTEEWEVIRALSPADGLQSEMQRRSVLLLSAPPQLQQGPAAELVLAADEFIIKPVGRVEDAVRAQATGDEIRSVIAGYHWFTDWGRDTMISLEGLTLTTGRQIEARWILRTFAHYVRDGIIPNMFPEGQTEGLYHTADATLWFFHALDRYLAKTDDRTTLRLLLPKLVEIFEHHCRGTRFGIGVDPADGLLRQGAEGYQLTWMDAKVGDWVVTPRRGKAVEINALWYNALRVLERWLSEERGEAAAQQVREHAEQTRESFNRRFWYAEGGYLYDVVDGETGDDNACRPNQILTISLPNPVLDESRWRAVVDVVKERLLTPVGLRSLSREHPEYKQKYYGDLRARDAAYHQGTVWGWLIGPFIDAWLKVHPGDNAGAKEFLSGFIPHLDQACIGSISEVFDAEEPYAPRGCVAQAWSVAEVLRCWIKTCSADGPREHI